MSEYVCCLGHALFLFWNRNVLWSPVGWWIFFLKKMIEYLCIIYAHTISDWNWRKRKELMRSINWRQTIAPLDLVSVNKKKQRPCLKINQKSKSYKWSTKKNMLSSMIVKKIKWHNKENVLLNQVIKLFAQMKEKKLQNKCFPIKLFWSEWYIFSNWIGLVTV